MALLSIGIFMNWEHYEIMVHHVIYENFGGQFWKVDLGYSFFCVYHIISYHV